MGNITVSFQAFSVCITHTLIGVSSGFSCCFSTTLMTQMIPTMIKFTHKVSNNSNSSLGVCALMNCSSPKLLSFWDLVGKRGLFDTASLTCANIVTHQEDHILYVWTACQIDHLEAQCNVFFLTGPRWHMFQMGCIEKTTDSYQCDIFVQSHKFLSGHMIYCYLFYRLNFNRQYPPPYCSQELQDFNWSANLHMPAV